MNQNRLIAGFIQGDENAVREGVEFGPVTAMPLELIKPVGVQAVVDRLGAGP